MTLQGTLPKHLARGASTVPGPALGFPLVVSGHDQDVVNNQAPSQYYVPFTDVRLIAFSWYMDSATAAVFDVGWADADTQKNLTTVVFSGIDVANVGTDGYITVGGEGETTGVTINAGNRSMSIASTHVSFFVDFSTVTSVVNFHWAAYFLPIGHVNADPADD